MGCGQGAQNLRSEAYLGVRRNDEECSATPHSGHLRGSQGFLLLFHILRHFLDIGG